METQGRIVFRSLLFPTDFSPFNERLARCLPNFKALGVEEILLVNVVEVGPQIGFASDTFENVLAWKDDAEPRLKALQRDLEGSGFKARWRLEFGKPAPAIVELAEAEGVSLIAMGTHGHGFLKGIMLGSVTHDVVRYAKVPVFVLKVEAVQGLGTTDCEFVCQHIFRRVLLPTDFSPLAHEAERLVIAMRSTGLSDVVLLHVRDDSHTDGRASDEQAEERLTRIQEEFEFFGIKITVIVCFGNPAKKIEEIADEQDVSLIVIGAHSRSAVADVLLGSVSDHVVCRHVRPVLVVRSNNSQRSVM